MERIEKLIKASKYCRENLCDSNCPLYEECINTTIQFVLDDEIVEEIQKLIDENRALKTELRTNGKKPDTLCPANDSGLDQTAKQDNGKLDPTLVPTEIIWAIAAIRRFGLTKYKQPDNWKTVEKPRLQAAAYRHWLEYVANNKSIDKESGLPSLWHCACNIAFLIAMEGWEDGEVH